VHDLRLDHGMGLITKKANWKVIARIGMSWILTLPIAALPCALIYVLARWCVVTSEVTTRQAKALLFPPVRQQGAGVPGVFAPA
jgi:hypothetical protein